MESVSDSSEFPPDDLTQLESLLIQSDTPDSFSSDEK